VIARDARKDSYPLESQLVIASDARKDENHFESQLVIARDARKDSYPLESQLATARDARKDSYPLESQIQSFFSDLKIRLDSKNEYQTDFLIKQINHVLDCDDASRLPYKPHKTVEMNYDGKLINIDENIAELIKLIWACGIHTINSCEDNIPSGYIWIHFAHMVDMRKFYQCIFNGIDAGSGPDRDVFGRAVNNDPFTPGKWYTKFNAEIDWQSKNVITDIDFNVSVRFPQSDCEFVCSKLKKYLENLKLV
jgi:hypothetical protein